jgi:hypothetical protein
LGGARYERESEGREKARLRSWMDDPEMMKNMVCWADVRKV